MVTIGNTTFKSRLFTGTGKFSSNDLMKEALTESGTELVTIALKRVDLTNPADEMISFLNIPGVKLLPNTSGVRDAEQAVFLAKMAREALQTNWVKLEIHPDPRYLMPDPIETLKAAEQLCREGFIVMPYINADPVLCKRLEEVGVAAVMPLGSPIGSNQGLKTRALLEIIIEQSGVPVVVDAGLGVPSHACEAMELGADAVLVNTAIAIAPDPTRMAKAFRMAVEAGRTAYETGIAPETSLASATSPTSLTGFLEN